MKTTHPFKVKQNFSKRGVAAFALGSIVFVLLVTAMGHLNAGSNGFLFALLMAGGFFTVAATGYVELVSGFPLTELKHAWATLRFWQRGMIGLFLTVTFLVVLACVLIFFMLLVARDLNVAQIPLLSC